MKNLCTQEHTRKYIIGIFVVIALILGLCAIQNIARAEAHNTVIAVYYEEDVAVIVDEEGNELLFDRDDLIPGDQLIFDGEDYNLVDYDYSLWYRVENRGIVVAEFLYEDDAITFAEELDYGRVYRIETVL